MNEHLPRLHSSESRPSLCDKLAQMNLSLAGCGFLGVYHVGVAACFRRYCPQLFNNRISGASAGAIAAAALICDMNLNTLITDLIEAAKIIKSHIGGPFNPFVSISNMLRNSLEKNLPSDAHVRCSGRLHISVTKLTDGCNQMLSSFHSRDDLIQALLCSSFIPIFSGWRPPTFNGTCYMDGCYSTNQPILDNCTVTVSPFCGQADICPRDSSLTCIVVDASSTLVEFTMENVSRMYMIVNPPSADDLANIANAGFNDAIRFMIRHELLKCHMCVLTTEVIGRAYTSCGRLITRSSCPHCASRQREVLESKLPSVVSEPLARNIKASRSFFRNWILDFPTVRRLLIIGLPWFIPYKILELVYKRILYQLPRLCKMCGRLAYEAILALKNGCSGGSFSKSVTSEKKSDKIPFEDIDDLTSVYTSYRCRVNVADYDGGYVSDAKSCSTQNKPTKESPIYPPAVVREFDGNFQVDFDRFVCSRCSHRASVDMRSVMSGTSRSVSIRSLAPVDHDQVAASETVVIRDSDLVEMESNHIEHSASAGQTTSGNRCEHSEPAISVSSVCDVTDVDFVDLKRPQSPQHRASSVDSLSNKSRSNRCRHQVGVRCVPSSSFDRHIIETAVSEHSRANSAVSWYCTDNCGNVRLKNELSRSELNHTIELSPAELSDKHASTSFVGEARRNIECDSFVSLPTYFQLADGSFDFDDSRSELSSGRRTV